MLSDATKIVGANGDRHPRDFYPTPPEVTTALINFLEEKELLIYGCVIWECACGNGDMASVFNSRGYKTINSDITSGDDFLISDYECSWIITNPPFKLAEDFIAHAAELVKPTAFLLKSQYWHSAKRLSIFRNNTPAYVLPLTWRPDFTGQGNSLMDMIWCVWLPGISETRYIPLPKPKEVT